MNELGKSIPYTSVNERHIISTKLNWLRRNILTIAVVILIILNVIVLVKHTDTTKTLQDARVQVVEEKNAHKTTSKRFSELKRQKMTVDSSLHKERLKTAEKAKEIESLKANLQAKKEREAEQTRIASEQAAPAQVTQSKPAPTAQVSGDKHSWLAASGIPQAHWGYVDSIVSRESSWNPNAVNRSSGACGLGQQLPCGKWPGAWNDPVAALKAMNTYVVGRYGGWPQAVASWNAKGWY